MSRASEIYWNERSEEHIARHGVDPEEVEDVVLTRPHWFSGGRAGTMLCYGVTRSGRHLLVVLADSTTVPSAWYCATARDMTVAERRLFSKRTS
ncbi:hypothetical protein ACIQI7_35855 [Kitasatospora sp. NPDC092039]|uniref:hypothetical protein n=1 Tax=Kitasatospora sp. NPDC092039 TaxID=3364086 RepID=UPI00382A3003